MPDEKDTPKDTPVDSGEFADNFLKALFSLGSQEFIPSMDDHEMNEDEKQALIDRITTGSSSYWEGDDLDVIVDDEDDFGESGDIRDGDCVL